MPVIVAENELLSTMTFVVVEVLIEAVAYDRVVTSPLELVASERLVSCVQCASPTVH